jgi:hypothetical protein
MMGNKKLSTIREELREAFAAKGLNPITALDRKIRKLQKSKSGQVQGLKSVQLLRNALAQIVEEKPAKPVRPRSMKRTKKVTK